MNKPKPIQGVILAFMKITILQVVLAGTLSIWAYGSELNGQHILDKKISISAQNEKAKSVLHKIEKKAEVKFTYQPQVLQQLGEMTFDYAEMSVSDILDLLLLPNVNYELVGSQIILTVESRLPASEQAPVSAAPVDFTVKGVVRDEFNEPLPGVNVLVKGTALGTTTDMNGTFSLEVPDGAAVLVFSFIGYQPQEVNVSTQTELNIVLQPDVKALEEVVVIGYGTARKVDLTGAVTKVNMEEKELQPNVNFVQALRGSIAGVAVTDNGRAGSDGSIVIRGFSSISASNAPLIVLDGIPYSGGLSDINSNDIESIDILKDGSSAAIYGSRASNGVIMITTKRGKGDRPRLQYTGYVGFSDFAHIPATMGPEKYLQLKQDASDYAGRDLTQLNTLEEENFQAGITIDPWEEIKQDAPMYNHELSISGKTDRVTYYLSGSYVDQKSPLMGDNFSRLSSRLNLDIAITDWLTIGTNTGFSVKDYSGNEASFGLATYLSPYSSMYFDDGTPRYYPMNDGLAISPIFATLRDDNNDVSNNLFSNIYMEVKLPLPGLTYRIRNGNTLLRRDTYNYTPAYIGEGLNTLGAGYKQHSKTFNLILENILRYDKTIAGNHHVDVTLLYGFETYESNGSRLQSDNIFNDALSYNGLNIGENQVVNTTAVESKAVSSMARVGYRFNERYMANFTVRRDGYSAFGAGEKYGVFPSMGLSWVLSNEAFMSAVKGVDLLKLRFSYGKNGNRGVNPYSSQANLSFVQYVFGDGGTTSIGLTPTSFANPNLGWETTISSNLGIDFGVLNNRISGSVELYNTNTSDLLLNLTIPNVTGYDNFFTNIGKMNNKGIEITLNTVNIEKGGFNWSSNVVYTLNRNEVVELAGKEDDIASRRFIGEPLFSNFDYVFDGIWQEGDDNSIDPNAKPGFIRFADINNDGAITPADRKVIGTSQPDFTWGFTNVVSFKNFSLSFLFSGRVGGMSANGVTNPGTNFYDRVNVLDLPYWTPENPLRDRPSVGYPNPYGYGFYQSRDYVRLQDVTLAYALPGDLLSRIRLSDLRFYVSGKNLKTWTDWVGYDPEHGAVGIYNPSSGILSGPLLKSWVFGVQVGL